jgi:hypothetical protein
MSGAAFALMQNEDTLTPRSREAILGANGISIEDFAQAGFEAGVIEQQATNYEEALAQVNELSST